MALNKGEGIYRKGKRKRCVGQMKFLRKDDIGIEIFHGKRNTLMKKKF